MGFQVAKKEYVCIAALVLVCSSGFYSLQVLYLLYIWGTYCVDGRQTAGSSPTLHGIFTFCSVR